MSWNLRNAFFDAFQPSHASSSIHMDGKRPCSAWSFTLRRSRYHLRMGWNRSFCSAMRSAFSS